MYLYLYRYVVIYGISLTRLKIPSLPNICLLLSFLCYSIEQTSPTFSEESVDPDWIFMLIE